MKDETLKKGLSTGEGGVSAAAVSAHPPNGKSEQKQEQKDREFLFTIAEKIRVSRSTGDLLAEISEAVGKYLGAHRCLFNEIDLETDTETVHQDYTRTGESVAGKHPISAYSAVTSDSMKAGQAVINRNSETDPRTAHLFQKTYGPAGELAYVAVPMLRNGKWVASLWCSDDKPRDWTDQEIALLENIAERTWAAVERLRVEEDLARSEEKYRTLFESIDEGFCTIEVLFDKNDKPVDYRFLDCNPAFARQTGIENAAGRRMREIAPLHEEHWFEIYGKIALTGEPMRFENRAEQLNRWYDVYAYRIGEPAERKVGVLFNDITTRKRHEVNLAFLAEISQDLVQMTKIDETMNVLGAKIGRFFGAKQCMFAEHADEFETSIVSYGWNAEGAPDLTGTYQTRDFLSDELITALMTGEPLVVGDTQADARVSAKNYGALAIRSFIIVPLIRVGEWRFQISVIDNQPREWRADEIELIREITNRIWTRLERARAEAVLREKDAELAAIVNETPFMLTRCSRDLRYRYVSRAYAEMLNRTPEEINGRPIIEIMGDEGWSTIAPYVERVLSGERVEYEDEVDFRNVTEPCLRVIYTPDTDEQGNVNGWFASIVDMTERRKAEAAIRESEERFRLATDAVQSMIYDWDIINDRIERSAELVNLLGFEPNEKGVATNKWWRTRLHPDDAEDAIKTVDVAIATGYEKFEEEFRIRHRDGHYVFVCDTGLLIRDENGKALRCVGSVADITRRKIAEEKLEESYETFFKLIQNAPFGVYLVDSQFRLAQVSAFSQKVFENVKPLIGRDFAEVLRVVWPEPFATEAIDRFRRTLATGEPYHSADTTEQRGDIADVESYDWLIKRITMPDGAFGVVCYFYDMTDRKRAELALRESRERLELAQDAGNVGIWDWDAIKNETYWSDTMWRFYGEEPLGVDPGTDYWSLHLYEADRERVLGSVEEALNSRRSRYHDVFRITRKDGSIAWIETKATILRDDAGKPLRMYGVNLDITERKNYEDRITFSENRLQALTDSIPALISYVDKNERYLIVNNTYTEWFGKPQDKIVGRSMREILGMRAYRALKPKIDEALSGKECVFEMMLHYKDAGLRYVHIAYMPDIRDDGVHGFYLLTNDLTELKHSQELLRSSEERLGLMAQSFPEHAIISTDPNGQINSWNVGAENIFGYRKDEILGKSINVLFMSEDVARRVPQMEMRKAMSLGRASEDRWHIRKDGSQFFASGVTTPLYLGRTLTGYAKIMADLTEKRRHAEELQHAHDVLEMRVQERTQELAQTNKALLIEAEERKLAEEQRIKLLHKIVTTQEDERQRIARDLHDQLGQRLTALRLKIASLQDLTAGDAEIAPRIARLQEISTQLDSEVSFLARELRPSALDDLGLVQTISAFVNEWSRHYEIPVEFHSNKLLQRRLNRDVETHLYRITQEALNNIVKHAKASHVTLMLERTAENVVLVIEDNGSGFDLAEQNNNHDTGKGLGLVGMRERAALINGNVEIEATPGHGTAIYVRIPAVNADRGK